MKKFLSFGLIVTCLLVACTPDSTTLPQSTEIKLPELSATEISQPELTATEILPKVSPTLSPLPLSEPGPYYAGKKKYTFVDDSRNGREIKVIIWYPALKQTDANGKTIISDGPPDLSGAPYPMILTSPNSAEYLFYDHLVSYGFVMAEIGFPDNYDYWGFQMIDHPQDMIFALDQIAKIPPEGLKGVIDSDHVGTTGYSSDGDAALTTSGVRIDPEFYLSQCEQASEMQPEPPVQWVNSICGLATKWSEFAIHEGDAITTSDDGLWQPITDDRIQAVMIMSSGGAWLYGDKGLASVNRPLFIIAATQDEIVPYDFEAAYIYDHLVITDRFLVSFIGKGHMMVFNVEQVGRMNHFATAFFGYYLQGKSDYADYFSENFVSQIDDLAWGVYEK